MLLLLHRGVSSITPATLLVNKKQQEFFTPSWQQALVMMVDSSFLRSVQMFEKDKINEETVELLAVYVEVSHGVSRVG